MATASPTSASKSPADPWDQPLASSSARRRPPVTPVASVPDDWENDDNDDDIDDRQPQNTEDNQRIWDDANTKAPNPMPSLIISPSATSARAVLSPPAGAFQPTMRILKRPSATSSASSTPPPTTPAETLNEREARYQAARDRIFGEERGAQSGKEKKGRSPKPAQGGPTTVTVVRNPRGPGEASTDPGAGGAGSKGFAGRRRPVATGSIDDVQDSAT